MTEIPGSDSRSRADDRLTTPNHGCGSCSDGHLLGVVGRAGLFERELHSSTSGSDGASTNPCEHSFLFEELEVLTNGHLGNTQPFFQLGDAHMSGNLDGTLDRVSSQRCLQSDGLVGDLHRHYLQKPR